MSTPVEEFNPYGVLDDEEATQASYVANVGGALSNSSTVTTLAIGAALGGAFLVYRDYMRKRLQKRIDSIDTKNPDAMAREVESLFRTFMPAWQAMIGPVLLRGYLNGVSETGLIMDSRFLTELADNYAYSLGQHINDVSGEALVKGYAAQVNRKIPAKIALANVIDAFGVTSKTARSLNNVLSAKEDAKLSETLMPSVKNLRSRQLVAAAIKQRADTIGGQESWNAHQTGKQVVWMYAMRQGIIPETATRTWVTAVDELVCPYCGPMHKAEQIISEPFQMSDGQKVWSPPVHPNCRCEVTLNANLGRKLAQDAAFGDYQRSWMDDPEVAVAKIAKADDWDSREHPRSNRSGRFVRAGMGGAAAAAPPPTARTAPAAPPRPPAREGIAARQAPPQQGIVARPGVSAGPAGIRVNQQSTGIKARVEQTRGITARQEQGIAAQPTGITAAAETKIEAHEPKGITREETALDAAPTTEVSLRSLSGAKSEAIPFKTQPKPAAEVKAAPKEQVDLASLERPAFAIIAPRQTEGLYGGLDMDDDDYGSIYFTGDLDELETVADQITMNEIDGWVKSETESGTKAVKAFDDGGMSYEVRDQGLFAAFEYLMHERMIDYAYQSGEEDTILPIDPTMVVTLEGQDKTTGSWGSRDVPVTELIFRMGLREEFEEMLPVIAKVNTVRVNDMSDHYLNPRGQGLESFNLNGRYASAPTSETVKTTRGYVFPYEVMEIEPSVDD